MGKFLRRIVMILTVLALLGSCGVYYWYLKPLYHDLAVITASIPIRLPALSTVVYDRKGRYIGEFSVERRYWVALDDLPKYLREAFLSAEDRDFFSHHGISPKAILRAAFKNVVSGEIVQGGSTITQQLARSLFLSSERTFSRKIREALLATLIEERLSKEQILEYYLNHVFLGNHSYGVEAAAQNYFRKRASDLNPAEAAMLAGLPQAPSRYAPHRHFDLARLRQKATLQRMVDDSVLSKEEARRWYNEKLFIAEKPQAKTTKAGYFLKEVAAELKRKLAVGNLPTLGWHIYTTIDLDLHRQNQEWLRQEVEALKKTVTDLEGASVYLHPQTGEVLSFQGGVDFTRTQFDRVKNARRPIGELVIPLFAANAIDHGYTLTSSLFYPGKPARGSKDLSLFEAVRQNKLWELGRLYNTLGRGTVDDFFAAMQWRVSAGSLGLVSGDAGLSLMEVARGYAVLANGGRLPQPYFIERVLGNDGETIYQHRRDRGEQILAGESAFIVSNALDRGDGQTKVAAASQSLTDLWVVRYNAGLLAAAWMGSEYGGRKLHRSREDAIAYGYGMAGRVSFPGRNRMSPAIPEGIDFFPVRMSGQQLTLPFRKGTTPKSTHL